MIVKMLNVVKRSNDCRISPAGADRLRGFTLVEMLVVIAIIAVLASLMLPVLGRGKEHTHTVKCQQQLLQISYAIMMYADEHDHTLPSAERMPSNPVFPSQPLPAISTVLSNYVSGVMKVFACPKDTEGYFQREGTSYEWNWDMNGKNLGNIVVESPEGKQETLPNDKALLMSDFSKKWHPNMQHLLYADGHISDLKTEIREGTRE